MPYSVKREKELLTALLTQEMGLVRAMSYFSKSASSLDKKASGLGLRGLENYDLIKIWKIDPFEEVWLSDEVLGNPENYKVIFNSFSACENEMSEVYEDVLSSDIQETAKDRYYMEVIQSGSLVINGELEGAMTLAERSRVFTHQFAFHIANRAFDKAHAMFSTKLKKMKTIANLSNDFEKRFKLYGEFELFDHVSVIEIFNGPTGWRVALDKEWWPKDTDKKTRRAETDFELGSIITPGGVMINGGYHMRLCIVEEEGLFKVHHYHLFTGN